MEATKNISLTLRKGETLAIVGESGSGKSVTGLALTRLLPEPPTVYQSGEILYKGRDVLKMSPGELRAFAARRSPTFSRSLHFAEPCLHDPQPDRGSH